MLKRIINWFIMTFVLKAHKVWAQVNVEVRKGTEVTLYTKMLDLFCTKIYDTTREIVIEALGVGEDELEEFDKIASPRIYETLAEKFNYKFKMDRSGCLSGYYADVCVHDKDLYSRAVMYDIRHWNRVKNHLKCADYIFLLNKAEALGCKVECVKALPTF